MRLVSRLPPSLRSSRQLAREALLNGALQKPSEFGELLGVVRRMQPSVIVEIGAAGGGATYGFRLAAPDAEVIGIDVDAESATISGDSHAPATFIALEDVLHGRGIDVLFIDGDHSYDGVRQDFETYARLVRPGGLIAFHDILDHPMYPQFEVHRFWRELTATREHREFVDPEADWGWGQWGGIGVITAN